MKDNFLAGRCFWNLSDLNSQAFEWCEKMNARYRKEIDDIPHYLHLSKCSDRLHPLEETHSLLLYLCPLRRLSFDGFINYEGRRFGVPYRYTGKTVRVCRKKEILYIYTPDLSELLVTHDVTWSKRDRYCRDQFEAVSMLEEFPTAPVKTCIRLLETPEITSSFDKFNFSEEVHYD